MGSWWLKPATTPAGSSALVDDEYTALVQDTIYELYKPSVQRPSWDIVFFHGLQLGDYHLAYKSTWESTLADGRKVCWPKEFLSKDFPNARVLSVSYDASARKTADAGYSDLETLGKYLAEQLTQPAVGVGRRPVVLVGHSLGGLVMKQVCLELDKRTRELNDAKAAAAAEFLKNIKGLVFYSTPHLGSKLVDLAVATAGLIASPGAVVSYLKALAHNADMSNHAFDKLRNRDPYKWPTLGFWEALPTKVGLFSAVVVEQTSACQAMDDSLSVHSDHINVCKPTANNSPQYMSFQGFLVQKLNVEGPSLRTGVEQPRLS